LTRNRRLPFPIDPQRDRDPRVFFGARTGASLNRNRSEASDLYLSLASVWEILIKSGIGQLPIPTPAVEYIAHQMRINRVNPLPIRMPHLKELEALAPVHRDPFDRMLVAQARAEGMPILSADPQIKKYGVAVL